MNINIGDSVEVIDDAIKGIVKKIKGNTVVIEDEDGFYMEFSLNELIKIEADNNLKTLAFSNTTPSEIKQQKEGNKKRKITATKPKKRHQATFVVDLHIHQITDSTKRMSNFDMLNLQLDTARGQLDFAIRQRMPKMVFIHGIGEGVLKQELYTILRRYNNVTFYDADYKEYGLGATEIKIFQNVEP